MAYLSGSECRIDPYYIDKDEGNSHDHAIIFSSGLGWGILDANEE